MTSPTCFVLDHFTHEMLYRAASMEQAVGFVDARERPSLIALSASTFAAEFKYRLALVDATNGQVLATGPAVDLFDAANELCNLKIVILPCLADDIESEVLA